MNGIDTDFHGEGREHRGEENDGRGTVEPHPQENQKKIDHQQQDYLVTAHRIKEPLDLFGDIFDAEDPGQDRSATDD